MATSAELALEAKAKGNAAFQAGDFATAVQHFTKAIELSPSDAVLYSNRSGAYASLKQFENALNDAEMCVKLKPDWAKVGLIFPRQKPFAYTFAPCSEFALNLAEGAHIEFLSP